MSDKPWKATERHVAGLIGGKRVPVSGRGRGDSPDIAHPWLSIEVKHRRALPQWLDEALDQAAAASGGGERLPVAILHEAGERHGRDVVLVRLADFRAWFGSEVIDDG